MHSDSSSCAKLLVLMKIATLSTKFFITFDLVAILASDLFSFFIEKTVANVTVINIFSCSSA